MFLRGLRIFCRLILKMIARVDIQGMENIPQMGGALIVSNHLGRLDAILGVVLAERDDVVLMVANKYEKNLFWRLIGNKLNAIWLNREDADFHALREVTKRLKAGQISAVAPEGTRSKTEALLPGKSGAAYLAMKTAVPVVPVALWGTEDRVVKQRLLRLQRVDIHIRIGKPFELPPIERGNRDQQLAQNTEEIMLQIAALLPEKYRGVYANHPRLLRLWTPPSSTAVVEPGS